MSTPNRFRRPLSSLKPGRHCNGSFLRAGTALCSRPYRGLGQRWSPSRVAPTVSTHSQRPTTTSRPSPATSRTKQNEKTLSRACSVHMYSETAPCNASENHTSSTPPCSFWQKTDQGANTHARRRLECKLTTAGRHTKERHPTALFTPRKAIRKLSQPPGFPG